MVENKESMFNWGDIAYEVDVETYKGHIMTITTYAEEGITDIVEHYGPQVKSIRRVQNAIAKQED
jgi:predicted glycosyltransferase